MASASEGKRVRRIPREIVVGAYGPDEREMNVSGSRADVCSERRIGLFVHERRGAKDRHGASDQRPHGRPLAVQEHREGDHDQGGGGYDGQHNAGGGYGQSPLVESHAESGVCQSVSNDLGLRLSPGPVCGRNSLRQGKEALSPVLGKQEHGGQQQAAQDSLIRGGAAVNTLAR